MGRGGNFVLKGVPHAYRIRVTAPLDVRVERVVLREGVDRETARWLCGKTDSERACFLHSIYGGRWDDPSGYDRVYVVTGPSVDAEVAGVVAELGRRTGTDEGLRALRMRVAAARVKAGIATDPSLFLPVFDALPEGDRIVLRGVVHAPRELRRVEDAARRLAGEVPVRSELHYRK